MKGFVGSAAHATTMTSASEAIYAVKGWYDEQRLAFPSTAGSGLVVGSVRGTFLPMPDLGNDSGAPDTSRYARHWIAVATASVEAGSSVYLKKLNLQVSPVRPSSDSVYLCYGARAKCPMTADPARGPQCKATGDPEIWWARIVSSGAPPSTHYFCVQRREHANVHIPGVVRWRWAVKDETMWIRCLEGCCEVEAGSKDTM
jgi:hypothetical protein